MSRWHQEGRGAAASLGPRAFLPLGAVLCVHRSSWALQRLENLLLSPPWLGFHAGKESDALQELSERFMVSSLTF